MCGNGGGERGSVALVVDQVAADDQVKGAVGLEAWRQCRVPVQVQHLY